jgi:hypothetical protein
MQSLSQHECLRLRKLIIVQNTFLAETRGSDAEANAEANDALASRHQAVGTHSHVHAHTHMHTDMHMHTHAHTYAYTKAQLCEGLRGAWNPGTDPDPQDKSDFIRRLGAPGARIRVSEVLARLHTNP